MPTAALHYSPLRFNSSLRLVLCRSIWASFILAVAVAYGVPASAQVPTRAEIDGAQNTVLPTDPATVVAVVGESSIYLYEISPKVEGRIAEVLSKTQQEVPEDQLKFVRVQMTKAFLRQAIQNRMMRESFLLDQVGTQSADKRHEADETMQAKARQMFFESELPELMKQYDAKAVDELDGKLREKGTSLAVRQREFMDAMLGHLYIRAKVEKDPSVSLSEIYQYYRDNQDKYVHKARARWEQLTVQRANYPTRQAAYDAIWAMGREAFFGGNMQAVARQKSEEPFGAGGGLHDWTNQGSLVAKLLEAQIFQIPTGEMSQIIEETDAFHIVRVLEREEAGLTPLADCQDDIRKIIRESKIAEAQEKVMVEVQRKIPVWSIYPDDVPGAKPLQIANRSPATNNAVEPMGSGGKAAR